MKRKKLPKTNRILENIRAEDALDILKNLAKDNEEIASQIEDISKDSLKKIDINEIAENVEFDLSNIDVEELWDRSGRTRYGYVEPGEMADEMIEEVLEPYFEEMCKYKKLLMHKEAKYYCMGILKGIRCFENESSSEFSEWATDAFSNFSHSTLEKWKSICKNQQDIKEIKEFIKNIVDNQDDSD